MTPTAPTGTAWTTSFVVHAHHGPAITAAINAATDQLHPVTSVRVTRRPTGVYKVTIDHHAPTEATARAHARYAHDAALAATPARITTPTTRSAR